jgi:hypothetical protein
VLRSNTGSLAVFAAVRRPSSRVSNFASRRVSKPGRLSAVVTDNANRVAAMSDHFRFKTGEGEMVKISVNRAQCPKRLNEPLNDPSCLPEAMVDAVLGGLAVLATAVMVASALVRFFASFFRFVETRAHLPTSSNSAAGCSIVTVSTAGATGCFIRFSRAAFFAGVRLGLALATVGFAVALTRLFFWTFDDCFLRLAMVDPPEPPFRFRT